MVISQEGGDTRCLRLTLRGADFPAEFTPERKELVKEASALNEEGKSLYQEKKLEGALAKDGRFHSDTLLVKHDGTYRAPTDVKLPGRN